MNRSLVSASFGAAAVLSLGFAGVPARANAPAPQAAPAAHQAAPAAHQGAPAAAAPAAAKDAMPYVNPESFKWVPKDTLPPGAFAAVVNGDTHTGNYDFFGKFPAKYTVPMHWHTNDVNVVMVKGSMVIGRDKQPNVEIKEGGFFLLPGGLKYTAHCENECIFLAHGDKPFDIFYQNPKDDPRQAKAAAAPAGEKKGAAGTPGADKGKKEGQKK